MRASLYFVALLVLVAQASFAGSGRTALQSTPLIEGRAIDRILLLAPLVVNDSRFATYVRDSIEVRIPAGTFTPVSEDRKGVFFQAANSFARLKFPGPVSGGFYVSKARQNRMTAYVGDARADSREEVDKAKVSLTADQFRYLRFDAAPSLKR